MTPSALVLGPLLRYVDEVSASLWFETRDAAAVVVHVGDQSFATRTFGVHGRHYALVQAEGLHPDSVTPYTVDIDGARVWPLEDSAFPASVIATLGPERALRLAFGSCRTSIPHDKLGNRTHGVDALRAQAVRAAADDSAVRPDLILFLGDQVYADVTSEAMQVFIRSRREISEGPGSELADFEEYAHLYSLAWSDPANRWLLSTVPTAMIFDDHDIRDDWNASLSWKREMAKTSWWRGRIVAGLASYWVYQHLGNLSPAARQTDEIWSRISAHPGGTELDLTPVLDAFAQRCDERPDSYRWSYSREFTDARVVVLDSRASRVLEPESRSLLGSTETAWLNDQLRGDVRHLFIGTSLPFLLPTGLHHLESWDEAVSEGAWGPMFTGVGERMRRAVDLEHWGAFQTSFRRVAEMVTQVADGRRGAAPETVMFLSGDVHFSYAAEVDRTSGSRILQAVCSPIRNPLPVLLRSFSAVLAYGISVRISALLARSARVAAPPFTWSTLAGPWFDNSLATLQVTEQALDLVWESGVVHGRDYAHPRVTTTARLRVPRRSSAGQVSAAAARR